MRKCQIWSYVGGTCNIRFAFHKSNTLQIDKCTLILPLIDRIKFLGNIYCDSHNGPLLFLSIPLWGKKIKTLGPSSSGFMFSDMNNATPSFPMILRLFVNKVLLQWKYIPSETEWTPSLQETRRLAAAAQIEDMLMSLEYPREKCLLHICSKKSTAIITATG